MALLLNRVKQASLRLRLDYIYISHQPKRCYFQTSLHQSHTYYCTSYFQTSVHQRDTYYCTSHYLINQLISSRPENFSRGSVRFFAAPVQVVKKEEVKKPRGVRLNEHIQAAFVRLVTDEGHSVVARVEALQHAKKLKLDLVEVDPHAKPPVCKIMDYHKEKYKKKIKEKERTKIKSETSIKKGDFKEVRFSAKTELKDLRMKADMAKRLMERGYRVKCMAMGAEDQDLGGLLAQLSAMIEDVAYVESGPRVEKKQAYFIVRHVKFGPPKKGSKKASNFGGAVSSEFQATASPRSHNLVDMEEASSEEYATENDDAIDTTLQWKQDIGWSVSDAKHGIDKGFDVSDYMKRTSSSDKQMNFDAIAYSSAENSKTAGFSPHRVPNFIEQNVRPTQEPENRYARNVMRNVSAVRNNRLPNHGSQPQSPSDYLQAGGHRQARKELPQNDIQNKDAAPQQGEQYEEHDNFAASVGQDLEWPNSASSRRSQTSGFGIFSAREADASDKFGSGVAVNQCGSPLNPKKNSMPGKLLPRRTIQGGRKVH